MSIKRDWAILLSSIPLISLNILVLFMIHTSIIKILEELNRQKQRYKIQLLMSFGWVIGIAAAIYAIWGVTETILKYIYSRNGIWKYDWIFISIWDLIFILVALSMVCIWRVNKHSQTLAFSHQLGGDDDHLSEEAAEMH